MKPVTTMAVSGPGPRARLILLTGLAAIGALSVVFATRWGVGTSPDSVTYLGVADNVQRGFGWTVPFGSDVGRALVQFPPLYPGVLALSGTVAGDLGTGARYLQVVLMAANVLLVAVFLVRVNGSWAPIAGAALMAAAPSMILIHSMAWSEALFLFLGFSGLLILAHSLDRPGAASFWVAAGLVSLAALTRLAGAAFLVTGVIAILLEAGRPRARLLRAVRFGLVAGLPVLIWLIWSGVSAGSLANRAFEVHPIGRVQVQQAVGTMAAWLFLPDRLPGFAKALAIAVVGLGATAVLVGLGPRMKVSADSSLLARRTGWPREIRILSLFAPTYLGVLAVATTFFDANVPWDDRILSPVFVSAIVLGIAALDRVARVDLSRKAMPRAWFAAAVWLVAWVWVAGFAVRSGSYAGRAYQEGLGFRQEAWRASETLANLASAPAGLVIYSNSPHAIYTYTGRAARAIPAENLQAPPRTNPDFPAELETMRRAIAGQRGAVAYFYLVSASSYPSLEELIDALTPVDVDRASDGAILTLGTSTRGW